MYAALAQPEQAQLARHVTGACSVLKKLYLNTNYKEIS